MRITLRLFAGLRERAGVSRREVELPDGATVADVWPAPARGPGPGGLVYAVNGKYAARARALRGGDEVGLIPPVSGGAFELNDREVSLDAVVREVASDA